MNLNYHKMKFLRLAFYVLVAQQVLSGCAGEAVEETSSSSSSEINFDAYVGRNASTRSSETNIDFLKRDIKTQITLTLDLVSLQDTTIYLCWILNT